MNNKFDTVIIGAGLSGLLCGAYLSKMGHKVCILEKHKKIGGAIQTFKRKNTVFDTGMHFFGAIRKGQIQYELFKLFGIIDDLKIQEIKEFTAVIEDDEYIIYPDKIKFAKKIKEYFPNEKDAIDKYVAKITEVINNITIKNIRNGFELNSNYSEGIVSFVESITDNKKLQDVFLFDNMLYGGEAKKASIYIHSVINGSFMQSAGLFEDSTQHFLDVMKNAVEKNGGKVITSQEIIRLDVDGANINFCETKKGEKYFAKNYISTLHPKQSIALTDSKLIKKFFRKRISNLENTYGTFLLFIKMKEKTFKFKKPYFICDKRSENGFNISYMFYSPPANKDEDFANVIKVMLPMQYSEVEKWKDTKLHKRPSDYNEFKKNKAEETFDLIEKRFPGFKKSIDTYYSSTPLTYRDYTGIEEGSAYGILNDYNSPIKSMISIRTRLKGFYLSGQNLNFHGMLGVSITSLITCDAIINDNNK